MSDGFKLAEILNPDMIRAYLNQMQQESPQVSAQAAPPSIPADVPVRYVPAPKVLHGTVEFKAIFTHDQLEGKNYDMLKGMVMDVFSDPNANNAWLPEVSINNLEMWEERVDDRPAANAGTAAIHGGIPQAGDSDGGSNADYPWPRIPDAPTSVGPAVRPSLLRGSVTGGGGVEGEGRTTGTAGDGPGGGEESGTGGSGWQPTFPASEEEDQEAS